MACLLACGLNPVHHCNAASQREGRGWCSGSGCLFSCLAPSRAPGLWALLGQQVDEAELLERLSKVQARQGTSIAVLQALEYKVHPVTCWSPPCELFYSASFLPSAVSTSSP